MGDPVFKRVLLKLSGEALMGQLEYGTDPQRVVALAAAVRGVVESGVQLAIVPGGASRTVGSGSPPRARSRPMSTTTRRSAR